MPSANRGFGWIPNRDNPSALRFSAHPAAQAMAIPPVRYLTTPASLDQETIGSCTAHGVAMAVAILALARGFIIWLSRLMIYIGGRKRLGAQFVSQDSGAMPDDALATVKDGEAGPESLWPYVIAKFRQTPPAEAFAVAKQHDLEFHDFDGDGDVVLLAKQAIAAGFPVNLGFTIRQDARGGLQIDHVGADGLYPWTPSQPLTNSGHDVLVIGYDDAKQEFMICNSWGTSWGCAIPGQPDRGRGCFKMSYAMFASSDVANRSAVTDWK